VPDEPVEPSEPSEPSEPTEPTKPDEEPSTPAPPPRRIRARLRHNLPAGAGIAIALVALLVVLLLGRPAPAPPPEPLASDQTLSFPIAQDVSDLDPALISSPSDVDIFRNVFSGLYTFDSKLREVPDLAIGQPGISADGLTYTFHIRAGARFSNGDAITAADFIYSWSRAVAKQGDLAGLFDIVAGYDDVASGKSSQMSGLVKLDDHTLQVTLVKPAGYFQVLTALWPFWIVDQNVIASAGDTMWTAKPETLVGSGPFHMTARTRGQSLDFEPVAGWYGGKTGALTHVHVDVLADPAAQVAKYEAGVYSLLGYARQPLGPDAATRYTSDLKLKDQLTLVPSGTSFWVGFNLRTGPFAGIDAGRAGRHAFTMAIDRHALEAALCNLKTTCIAATGGLISKGLRGYLGDGADPNAKFDPVKARAEYQAWDPTGAKVRGLTYTYDTNGFNKTVCDNLAAQWKKNLGVTVTCTEMDRLTFFEQRNGACAYPLFRQSWTADYNHPQDWFDYLFKSGASSSGSCYSNSNLDAFVTLSDADHTAARADSSYKVVGQTLVNDVAFGGLLYGVQQYLVHPFVRGAGGNALYDNPWTGVRIVKH
jgi:oligopeptide transport system substrate-binding protein